MLKQVEAATARVAVLRHSSLALLRDSIRYHPMEKMPQPIFHILETEIFQTPLLFFFCYTGIRKKYGKLMENSPHAQSKHAKSHETINDLVCFVVFVKKKNKNSLAYCNISRIVASSSSFVRR